MILLYMLLFLPLFVAAQESQSVKTLDQEMLRNDSRDSLDWIGESLLNTVDTFFPISKSCGNVEGRKKKKLNKYVLPLILGFLLIKSILLPITLKALAVLSGKAVVLSLMSLILAAIVGLKKVAHKDGGHHEVINKYRRTGNVHEYFADDMQEFEPYRLYKERRRKK